MSDIGILVKGNPENAAGNPSATAAVDPPLSITGAIADYVDRPVPVPNSLGIFMNDQERADAGIEPRRLGPLPNYSVVDATGSGDGKPAAEQGYGDAVKGTGWATRGGHYFAQAVGMAPAMGKAIADGQSVWDAVKEASQHPTIKGIGTLNKIYSPIFAVAGGGARALDDHRNGAPWEDAITGNGIRTALVASAGIVPFAGPILADKYMPNGAAMGHLYNQNMADTEGRSLLLP